MYRLMTRFFITALLGAVGLLAASGADNTLGLEAKQMVVCLADGSVILVSPSVSSQTWWAACTPNGGEICRHGGD